MIDREEYHILDNGGNIVDPELFLIEMSETEECKKIMYKRMAIRKFIGLYYAMKNERGVIDPFMIPFRDLVKERIVDNNVDIDSLLKYMIDNDESNCALFLTTTLFVPQKGLSSRAYYSKIAENRIITPYVDTVDMDVFALIVVSFIFDNFRPTRMDISEIVKGEIFNYPINQYGLTKVNGAIFKVDGLIFDGKGYYYNYFTNKTMLDQYDSMVGFARIIHEDARECDIWYRLDERLSMPEVEYFDYSGVAFAKFYGPQFKFDRNAFNEDKTIIVHMDEKTMDKLLMVIKKREDEKTKEEFWHIEIETLPYIETCKYSVITTFLHGMYYPYKDVFTHIDYTKNQYSSNEYLQKYTDSIEGMPIDQYTSSKELHYKIWCIENGEFTRETWYKLMKISLSKKYQDLLDEILN